MASNIFFNKLVNIFGIVLSVILCIILIIMVGSELISPIIAKSLARDQKNIKTNGCLIYGGKSKHGSVLYSLNSQMSRDIDDLAVDQFPFAQKWKSYDVDFRRNFHINYANNCFKVKYISTKLLWLDVDFIYDVE